MDGNLLYAQSGGVTAVINQSAAGAIFCARSRPQIRSVFAAQNGVTGILREQLINCDYADLSGLAHSPGGYFGSCRYKLPGVGHPQHQSVMRRILDVFEAHNIRYFLYNGGGDSQDTLLKISQFAQLHHYPLKCVGIPKTIDNDLAGTDNCPGFGSAAKYLALSTAEVACDLRAMHHDSTKLFVMEVMGRNTGWLAAATSLAGDIDPLFEPDAIVVPERVYAPHALLQRCRERIAAKGFCLVVVAEGTVDENHHTLSRTHDLDPFGHPQLGGIAPQIARYLQSHLKVKTHWSVPDYLQRCARHIAATIDVVQATEVAQKAVDLALAGSTDVMVTIRRLQDSPYAWDLNQIALAKVANNEKALPYEYLSPCGLGISDAGKRYLRPLIDGESPPPYFAGLPQYSYCQLPVVTPVLPSYELP